MTLTEAIREANTEIDIAEAALTAAGHALQQPNPVEVARELLHVLFDDTGVIDTRWDVPRVCTVLIPNGRHGRVMTEDALRHCVKDHRFTALVPDAFTAMHREGLTKPLVTHTAAEPVSAIVEAVQCPGCGHEHFCQIGRMTPRERVRRLVLAKVGETGQVPSSRAISRLMGKADDRMVRHDWDALTAGGDLPSRPVRGEPAPSTWRPPHKVLGWRLTPAGEELARDLATVYGKTEPGYVPGEFADRLAAASGD